MARPSATPGRRVAHRTLTRVYLDDAYADRALHGILDKFDPPLDKRERAFATELVYGVLRNHRYIDFLIRALVSKPLRKIQPDVIMALRLAVYELLFLRAPAHSTVDQAVRLLNKKRDLVRSFANAVLRELGRRQERNELPQVDASALPPLEALAIKTSLPDSVLQRVNTLRPFDDTEAWAESNQKAAPFTNRVNQQRTTRDDLMATLTEAGIEHQTSSLLPFALDLQSPGNLQELQSFRDGHFSVQDAGSQLVCHLLEPQPGERIVDLCAAPGGKTSFIAELTGDEASILACDLHPGRVRLISTGQKRLQLKGIETTTLDGTNATLLAERVKAWGDGSPVSRVLLDAPCSGLGTLRRNPDLRLRPINLEQLTQIQSQLLESAHGILKPGGTLVYSVCTFTREESVEIISQFLNKYPNYHVSPLPEEFAATFGDSDPDIPGGRFFRTWADVHGCDGFFAIKLQKSS